MSPKFNINNGILFPSDIQIISPDSVTSINKDAFSGCIALKRVVIPDSVTDDLTLPENATIIRRETIKDHTAEDLDSLGKDGKTTGLWKSAIERSKRASQASGDSDHS